MKTKIYTVAHPEDLSPPVANQGFCVDVVLATDYAELESRMGIIRELVGVSEKLLEEAQKAYQAQAEELAAAGKMIEKLAAENVALKAFGDKLSEMHNALNGEGTGIQGRAEVACQQVALEAAMEEFDDIKTPATDRIVAGIKADGVALVKSAFEEHIQSPSCYQDEVVGMESALSIASQVESRLREGADK